MSIRRSPLEHEPDFVAGIGLLTARWAMLEAELATTLGLLIRNAEAGPTLYYALGSFQQRLNLIRAIMPEALTVERHRHIVRTLISRIARLWSDRNKLVHSHYVHRTVTQSTVTYLSVAGPELGQHPKHRGGGTVSITREDGSVENPPHQVLRREFGYRVAGTRPLKEFVPVNIGTFTNHADAVAKRSFQVDRVNHALRKNRLVVRPLVERRMVDRHNKSYPYT